MLLSRLVVGVRMTGFNIYPLPLSLQASIFSKVFSLSGALPLPLAIPNVLGL